MTSMVEKSTRGYAIGIDPDVDRSGYAVIDLDAVSVRTGTAPLPSLLEIIGIIQADACTEGKQLTVYVEAGWINPSNWHVLRTDSKLMAAKKGLAVGRNQQRGLDIVEMLRSRHINVVEVPPLQKRWRGADRKITHRELARILPLEKKRTNQEERDAALLAWVYGRRRQLKFK